MSCIMQLDNQMDENINIDQNVPLVPPKRDYRGDVKRFFNKLSSRIPKPISDPKNRKIVLLIGVIIGLFILLIVASLLKTVVRNTNDYVNVTPIPSSVVRPTGQEETLEQQLDKLQQELLNSDFEDKTLAPPQMKFNINFEL